MLKDDGQQFKDRTEHARKHGKEDPSEAEIQRRVTSRDETRSATFIVLVNNETRRKEYACCQKQLLFDYSITCRACPGR